MKKISQLLMTLGCFCILVSCALFGYSFYRQNKEIKDIQTLYTQTKQLIPDSYISSEDAYLDIDGHDIYAILQVNDIKWVIGHEESLPHYKNKNIIIPESLLKQVQSLKNRDLLTIHSVSGETIKYQLEVIGKVDQLSKSIPTLYCKNGSSYYCINLIKV